MKTPDARAVAAQVTRHVLAFRGEERANLLRMIGVAAFYALHLFNVYALGMVVEVYPVDTPFGEVMLSPFNTAAMALALGWAGLAAVVIILLRNRVLPRFLPVVTTVADVALLTMFLFIADGPRSSLAVLYFPIIGLAGLRGDRRLVWLSAVASIGCYCAVVGFVLGWRPELAPTADYHVLAFVLALIATGLVSEQVAGMVERGADLFETSHARARHAGAGEAGPLPEPEPVPTPLKVPHRPDGSCGWCGTSNTLTATRCWLCRQPLVDDAPFRVQPRSVFHLGPLHLGWTITVVLLGLLLAAVGLNVAAEFPALLVPYGAAVVLVLLAVGRMLQMQLQVQGKSGRADAVVTLATGALFSVTIIATVVVVSVLLLVAAMVALFAICLLVMAGSLV